jgi:hypothetical protein
MRKFLLNLTLCEPLALVQELPCFDNSIKLGLWLASVVDMFVHNMITRFLFNAVDFHIYWCQLFLYLLRCAIMVGNKVEGDPH